MLWPAGWGEPADCKSEDRDKKTDMRMTQLKWTDTAMLCLQTYKNPNKHRKYHNMSSFIIRNYVTRCLNDMTK